MTSLAISTAIDKDRNGTVTETTSTSELSHEIDAFVRDCSDKYHFNSRWDNVLNICAITLSLGVVSAGVFRYSAAATILGAIIAAMISAQRAFPFGQRAVFYRNLVGQAKNLRTDLQQSLIPVKDAVAILKTLRLDFAQQLPRGTTSIPDHSAEKSHR
jgi:hypothetical protein